MGTISRTSFNDSDIPSAVEWDAQFDTLYDEFNGSIENANFAANGIKGRSLGTLDEDRFASPISFGPTQNFSFKENVQDPTFFRITDGSGFGTICNALWYTMTSIDVLHTNVDNNLNGRLQLFFHQGSAKAIANPVTVGIGIDDNANIATLTGADVKYSDAIPVNDTDNYKQAGIYIYSSVDTKWILLTSRGYIA